MAFAKGHQGGFGLQGHGIGDQATAGTQGVPAGVQHPRRGEAAADEDGIRGGQPGQGLGRLAGYQVQRRSAEVVAVVEDMGLATGVGLDGQHPAAGMAARPFDADGAATGAHVPQQFAGARCQAGQGHGAYVSLGQLAVVAIGAVRQTGGERQTRLPGLAQDLDGH